MSDKPGVSQTRQGGMGGGEGGDGGDPVAIVVMFRKKKKRSAERTATIEPVWGYRGGGNRARDLIEVRGKLRAWTQKKVYNNRQGLFAAIPIAHQLICCSSW